MKKLNLAVLASALFTAAMLIITPAAMADSTRVFTISEPDVKQGDTFVSVLRVAEDSGTAAFQIRLLYDPEIITVDKSSVAVSEDCLGTTVVNASRDGRIIVNFTRAENLTSGSDIINIPFTVNPDVAPGSYDVFTFDQSYDYEVVGVSALGGIENVDFTCDFAPMTIYEFGDANLDGRVSIIDPVGIRRHLAHFADSLLNTKQQYYSDVDASGTVTIADPVNIQQYLAQLLGTLGDRYTVTFYRMDGTKYAARSVKSGFGVVTLPAVPSEENYVNGRWSASPDEFVPVDLDNVTENLSVYPVYERADTAAMKFYKERLALLYYSDTALSGNMALNTRLNYQNSFTAEIDWVSSDNSILNSTTGRFTRPNYDTTLTLTATIHSYNGGVLEDTGTTSFEYTVEGVYKTPAKSDIEAYLRSKIGTSIDFDMKLPGRITKAEITSSVDEFEVRVGWTIDSGDGVTRPINQINRSTSGSIVDLVATVSFNGIPLEDDGKIYFDDVELTAITQDEIKYHIVNKIASEMGLTLTNGEQLWNNDTKYGSSVRWITRNNLVAEVANNIVEISNAAINGSSLPLTAEVSYEGPDGAETFTLNYTVNVVTTNEVLVPGAGISQELYDALRAATGSTGGLTTYTLRSAQFVYLDLSKYPEITDLTGLAYCKNLRVLDISGLSIENGINEICSLNKLEALIAKNCGLSSLTDGGIPILKTMVNLKLLDLSDNLFTSLESVLDPSVRYSKLREVYLGNNRLTDVSQLARAPFLDKLGLSNNGLTNEDLEQLTEFKYLTYLSLADNDISSIRALEPMTSLVDLRLQNNHISDITPLANMTNLAILTLSNNAIAYGDSSSLDTTNLRLLMNLGGLQVLYLDGNTIGSIDFASALRKLVVLNVSNNTLTTLEPIKNITTLVEVYAENNRIGSFRFARDLVKLSRLMLANNSNRDTESDQVAYLSNHPDMVTLTLSGQKLYSLEFLNGMTKLERLDLQDCSLPAYYIRSGEVRTESSSGEAVYLVSDYVSNVAYLSGLGDTLKVLNISGNSFAYEFDDMQTYLGAAAPAVTSYRFAAGEPRRISSLSYLTNLEVLYADNVRGLTDAGAITLGMTELKYLSMENAGITGASWLSHFANLVYVDLAGNRISDFSMTDNIGVRSATTLRYLFLDSETPTNFGYSGLFATSNKLQSLSLAGMKLGDIGNLPYQMSSIRYLNLSDTDLTNLSGESDYYSIKRFATLNTIDVSGIQGDISKLTALIPNEGSPLLSKVYAISENTEKMFFKENLDTLYHLNANGVACYLYSRDEQYEPVSSREGSVILGLLDDISCDITIAAENEISSNNPTLVGSINNYSITWSVSDSEHYEIVDGKLSVKSYSRINDDALTLTAAIDVYPGQAAATRSFVVNTHILRASSNYIIYNTQGFAPYVVPGASFTYEPVIEEGLTDGFADGYAKPVTETVSYSETAVAVDNEGNEITVEDPPVIENILSRSESVYTIAADARLNTKVTVTASVGHFNSDGSFAADVVSERAAIINERGSEQVPIPSVVNLTYEQAQTALTALGFQLVRQNQYHDTVPDGSIVTQAPSAGSYGYAGDTVTLYVSMGPQNGIVPDVAGTHMLASDAENAIVAAGFNVNISYQHIDESEVGYGCVISQDVIGSLRLGSTVNITVSSGTAGKYITEQELSSYGSNNYSTTFEQLYGYRTQNMQYRTSGYTSLAGWEQYGSYVDSTTYGPWREARVSTSTTNNDTCQTVVSEDARGCWYYRSYTCNCGYYFHSNNQGYHSGCSGINRELVLYTAGDYATDSDTYVPSFVANPNGPHYIVEGTASVPRSRGWLLYNKRAATIWRSVTVKTVFQYKQWGNYSEWSVWSPVDNAPAITSDCNVETRTMTRYWVEGITPTSG